VWSKYSQDDIFSGSNVSLENQPSGFES